MIDSDTESENETHGAGECAFASTEEWIEDNVSWKLEDFTKIGMFKNPFLCVCHKNSWKIVTQDLAEWPLLPFW